MSKTNSNKSTTLNDSLPDMASIDSIDGTIGRIRKSSIALGMGDKGISIDKITSYTIHRNDLIHAKELDIAISTHIGSGAFSEVYKAKYQSKPIALKMTKHSKVSQKTRRQEMVVSLTLKDKCHRNILQILEIYQNSNRTQTWFLMKWIEGKDMWTLLKQNKGQFSEKTAKMYFKQMAEGLHFLHNLGIVHRDIKMANILIGQTDDEDRDVIKFIDFGFAKLVEMVNGLALCGSHMGTLVYMAPEVLSKEVKTYDAFKSDVYSLGVLLYRVLFGKFPFNDMKNIQDLLHVDRNSFAFPTDITVTESVKQLILNMICKDSEKRFDIKQVIASDWMQN